MSSSDEIFDLVENYTNGNMSLNEKLHFKKLLTTNSDIKEAYELNLLVDDLVLEGTFDDLSKLVSKERKKSSIKKIALFTAIGIGCIAVSFFIFNKDKIEDVNHEDKPLSANTKINSIRKSTPVFKIKEPTTKVSKSNNNSHSSPIDTEKSVVINKNNSLDKNNVQTSKLELIDSNNFKLNVVNINSFTPLYSLEDSNDSSNENMKIEKVNCEQLITSWELITTETCIGQDNGSIAIKGKDSELKLALSDSDFNDIDTKNLSVGNYTALITNENCSSEKKVEIIAKPCLEDYLISINSGLGLIIDEFDTDYTFSVFNQNGQIYYEQDIMTNEQLDWDGKNLNGNWEKGYYLLKIRMRGKDYLSTVTIVE